MSTTYQVLIHPTATPDNAAAEAERLRNTLIDAGIIAAETSSDVVLNGIGYLPGPKLNELYRCQPATANCPAELDYWNDLTEIGVQIVAEKWVNFFGFTVFNWMRCPTCEATFNDPHDLVGSLVDAAANFYNDEGLTDIPCPACERSFDVTRWRTKPDLGLCYVAALFWNWPTFESPGWQISIPEQISQALGVSLKTSFGRI